MLPSRGGLREVAPLGVEHPGYVPKTEHHALLLDRPLRDLFQLQSMGPAPRGKARQVSLNTCMELQRTHNLTLFLPDRQPQPTCLSILSSSLVIRFYEGALHDANSSNCVTQKLSRSALIYGARCVSLGNGQCYNPSL